jgi:protein-S-isoprenylcysteine O-methyltransferase Ste14
VGELTRERAILGTVAFFVLAPGAVAGVIPFSVTGWRFGTRAPALPLRLLGAAMILAGLASLAECFARFATRGRGTPAPVAPPSRLVVSGQYRYVRNPMYLAVLALVLGQAVVFGSGALLEYLAGLAILFHAFVCWYEEPNLSKRFGSSYGQYRRGVPRWLPRLTAWQG